MKRITTVGLATIFAMTSIAGAQINLLSNVDFALGSDGTTNSDTVAENWNEWTGGGW